MDKFSSIERQAEAASLNNFFKDSALKYQNGLPDGPFEDAIWPLEWIDYQLKNDILLIS